MIVEFKKMKERKLRKKKEKAINETNYDLIYTYCKELGDEYLKDDEYEEALVEYKEAENAAKKLDNKLYIAIANRMIGETLCFMGEFEEALAHQKLYLRFSKEESDLVEEQRALATLGRTYFVKAESFPNENDDKKECLELSRKHYFRSLNICDKLSLLNNLSQKQLSEMKSRLYLNLGLTLGSEGDIFSSVEHIAKAIHICEQFELMEDLCKCYIAQGSLFLKHGDTSKALSNYDEALKLSNRLDNRILFSCEILSLKADVFIEMSDFTGAKQMLIKAYKLKTFDLKEKREIENKLKILVMICETENKLLEISETDYTARRCLNETLGDCFVKLKCFKEAIQCYDKMLESSVLLGLTGKDLISAYFSLSQTYKDDGQYDMALKYFECELEIEKDYPIEAYKTLLNIIEILELRKENFDVIMEKYQQALSLAKKTGDFKTEADVLRNKIASEKTYNRNDLAYETQKELDVILCCISNEDSEIISNASDEEFKFDVDLEELSELNTDTEERSPIREKHPRRKITKSFLVRRNEKGETLLHVASAKGNLQLIKNLLSQGHPVNIPDAAGWSPLHEACNHGQIEAAKILIDAGANIDDRGGPNCDGITPLLDAASCGHLEIIDMLLDNGASPLTRNNQGETALDCLIACKRRVEFEEGELNSVKSAHFHSVKSRLENCLSKVGYNMKKVETLPKTPIRREESRSSQKLPYSIENSRKHNDLGTFNKSFSDCSATEYQDTIQAIRHRNKKKCFPLLTEHPKKSKLSALLNTEEVGDDWLEHDLEMLKRPTKRRCELFIGQEQIKKTNSNITIKSNESSSYQKKNSSTTVQLRWDNAFDNLGLNDLDFVVSPEKLPTHDEASEDSVVSKNTYPFLSQKKTIESKHQKSLQAVAFKRFNPPNHSTQQSTLAMNSFNHVCSIESSFTPHVTSSPTLAAVSRSVKVRLEGKLFLVPVPNDHSELNIKWLMLEASRRYQNFEGVSPVLSLSTEDGAILDENDPISIVIGKSEIHATVLSWNLPPLVERYDEACASFNIDTDEYLRVQLDMCQASAYFEIQNVFVQIPVLTPALKAISYYQNLQHICLCEVFLGDSGFKLLTDTTTKLTQLRCLDVSSNNVTVEGLSYFTLVLSKSVLLQNLEELNLSYNPLGDDSINQLVNLTRCLLRLRVFVIKSIGITSQSLCEAANFNLDFVEYLDISNNLAEREGTAKFLSALNVNTIKFLNLSRTGGSEVFRECVLFLDRGYLEKLNILKLADLDINDNDVEQLIQSLKKADQISKLDLSCNRKITLNSHRFLSELKNLKELHLAGCGLLTTSNQLSLPGCTATLSSKFNENTFKDAPYGLMVN